MNYDLTLKILSQKRYKEKAIYSKKKGPTKLSMSLTSLINALAMNFPLNTMHKHNPSDGFLIFLSIFTSNFNSKSLNKNHKILHVYQMRLNFLD